MKTRTPHLYPPTARRLLLWVPLYHRPGPMSRTIFGQWKLIGPASLHKNGRISRKPNIVFVIPDFHDRQTLINHTLTQVPRLHLLCNGPAVIMSAPNTVYHVSLQLFFSTKPPDSRGFVEKNSLLRCMVISLWCCAVTSILCGSPLSRGGVKLENTA
jgi:hypothetical protein